MSAPATTASTMTVTTADQTRRIRGRHDREVTRSVTGIASWPTMLVKTANRGPRPKSSFASAFSIRFSARCWAAGKLITLSCRT